MQSPVTASLCCVFSLAASSCSSGGNAGTTQADASSLADASASSGGDAGPASADGSAVDGADVDAGGSSATIDGGTDAGDAGPDVVPNADSACSGDGDGGSGTFTCTGRLAVARSAPGGAVLANGQVLIAGGWNNQTLTSSAELYDPVSGTFTLTGSMDSGHYLAGWGSPWPVFANGKVLVAGGLDASGALLASAELFDPATGTFSPTGALGTAVVAYDPVTLPSGGALFVGGYSSVTVGTLSAGSGFAFTGGTNQVQRYDPTSGAFASAGTLAENRLFGCNIVLASGKVLAIGGFQGVSTTYETNIEQYDPSTTTWSTVGTLPASGVYCAVSAFVLPSGKVFLDGSYLFDPVALTATPTTNAPPYTQETFMQLANGDVLALPPKSAAAAPNAYVYHDATGLWTEVGSPGFLGCRGFLLSSGEVLVVGGSDSSGKSQATGMIYHP